LATIKSQADQDRINALIVGVSEETWIGLTDVKSEGTYVWADGTPMTYSNWYSGQPNNWMGEENCVRLWKWVGGTFQWGDYFCVEPKNYICEIPKCESCNAGTFRSNDGEENSAAKDGCSDGSADVIFAAKVVGCDAAWSTPGMLSGAAACAVGWDICASQAEVAANGMTADACSNLAPAGTFYGSLVSGLGWKCWPDGPGQSGKIDGYNDLMGCGKSSTSFRMSLERLDCGVLTKSLGNRDVGTWTQLSGANAVKESATVVKTGTSNGGVLCCKKPAMPQCADCEAGTYSDGVAVNPKP
jgi:hypothetical protein